MNGTEVARAHVADYSGGAELAWTFHDVSDVGISVELINAGSIGGVSGRTDWKATDSASRVQIILDNPDAEVTMGFGVKANQSSEDESVAVDNFELRIPDPVTSDGDDIAA